MCKTLKIIITLGLFCNLSVQAANQEIEYDTAPPPPTSLESKALPPSIIINPATNKAMGQDSVKPSLTPSESESKTLPSNPSLNSAEGLPPKPIRTLKEAQQAGIDPFNLKDLCEKRLTPSGSENRNVPVMASPYSISWVKEHALVLIGVFVLGVLTTLLGLFIVANKS